MHIHPTRHNCMWKGSREVSCRKVGPPPPCTAPSYIHTYMHTYKQTSIQTYINTRIHSYIHAYLQTNKHTYIHGDLPETTWDPMPETIFPRPRNNYLTCRGAPELPRAPRSFLELLPPPSSLLLPCDHSVFEIEKEWLPCCITMAIAIAGVGNRAGKKCNNYSRALKILFRRGS